MSPPPRPPPWEERLAEGILMRVAPKLERATQPEPPEALRPWRRLRMPRPRGGVVGGTWYPAKGKMRGGVLLAPPWLKWGQAYYHRNGRLEALRAAGYASLTFDTGGFGDTTSLRRFRDADAEVALAELRRLAPGVPLHAWGVSSGGHWLHPVLAREGHDFAGAFFEDVTPHLLQWSGNVAPRYRAVYRALRRAFPRTDAYMDMRNHAPLRVRACAYVVGGADASVPTAEAEELARAAGGTLHVIESAGHLEAIKLAQGRVIALALATFAEAEGGVTSPELGKS